MKRSTPLKRGKPLKTGNPLARGTKPLKRTAKLKARKVPRAFRQRRDPRYLSWIRGHRCLLEGRGVQVWTKPGTGTMHACWGPLDVAHVRSRGAAGDDRANVVPLCRLAHLQQHSIGIKSFQARWKVDLKAAAADYWAAYQRETGAP